jgi:hypothetical protein
MTIKLDPRAPCRIPRIGGLRPMLLALAGLASLAAIATGCGPKIRRYPLADPLWLDADRGHVPKRPSKHYSGLLADGADQLFFRPLAKLFWFGLAKEARNVNSVDEVPNSSWFTNRIGLHPFTPADAARGACKGPLLDPNKGPWIVSSAKPDGANPGFFIKAPNGRRYLLKFDGSSKPERATTADVIGSKIYHAAGFNTPCNTVVYFREDILKISKKAYAENDVGKRTKLKKEVVYKVLLKAFRKKNGLLRASASQFVAGRPLGPFRFESTRGDDPNDVIPHQDRRELRGSRLLAAWLNHFDSREQNTLDVWTKRSGRTFLTHYIIDWGDSLGSEWPNDQVTRRFGHSDYFDKLHVLGDLLTLGLIPRPWNNARVNPFAPIFGYYGVRDFVASDWKPAYNNPAFDRMTFRDALWMTRIISRFTDAHVRAIVKTARLSDPRAERFLIKTLIARRDLILKEYLTRYAPLDRFRLVRRKKGRHPDPSAQSLCFEDLAIRHKMIDPRKVLYKFRFFGGRTLTKELGWLQFRPDLSHPSRACVLLPIGAQRPSDLAPTGSRDNHPLRYGITKVYIHQSASIRPTSSLWLHFYDLGPKRGFRLVGMHRQPKPELPAGY